MNSVNSANADVTETRREGWERAVYVNSAGVRAPGLAGRRGGGQLACQALGGGVEMYGVLVRPLDGL